MLSSTTPWGNQFPLAPALYVVAVDRAFPRLSGKTDILYIGQAGKVVRRAGQVAQATLRQRWTDYWQGTTETEREFRDTLKQLMTNERRVLVRFTERAFSPEALRSEEAALIARFHRDHLELPPLNRAKPRG